MAKPKGKKEEREPEERLVRKTILIDADKLQLLRQALGTSSDAETVRVALDHLLSHFLEVGEEE